MRLAPEQVWLFRLSGFVKFPELLPPDTVRALKEAIDADIRAEREPVVRNSAGRVVRLSNLLDRDPIFRAIATSPLVMEPLEDILGPNIEITVNRHNHATLRLAGAGDDYFHRDVPYWTRGLVTVLFYLEEASAERGCTQLIPSSHLLPWAREQRGLESLANGRLADQVVRVEAPAGGLLAIDSLLYHAVGKNKTPHSRTTLTFGYHAADTLAAVDDPFHMLIRGERMYNGTREEPLGQS